ncbi:MAG: FtsX-like permease family protein [Bacteroidales bacterium]|nr:FtsX-like permease family protein [Bacteroidales bacterium]
MNLPFRIAVRYFLARKSRLVNIISGVSLLSLAVATAAMLIIFSVMNGMNAYIMARFSSFDPDLRIEAVTGKYYTPAFIDSLRGMPQVEAVVPVLEDQALLRFRDDVQMIRLKGVDTAYAALSDRAAQWVEGYPDFAEDGYVPVSVGYGLASRMGLPLLQAEHPCLIYTVDAGRLSFALWQQALSSAAVYSSGIFSVLPEYDNRYVLAPISFVRRVLQVPEQVSAVEVQLNRTLSKRAFRAAQAEIRRLVGEEFTVRDRLEQQQTLYSSMQAEKWMMIAIFAFILLVSTFTMVSSLMLLMYEKRRDTAILSAQGMGDARLKAVFAAEGLLITAVGTLFGMLLGAAVVYGQARFGWVKFGMGADGTYVLETYPVAWQWSDAAVVGLISLGMGLGASAIPLRQINVYKKFK